MNANKGFTLIEVLVTLVVTSMFFIGISQAMQAAATLHNRTEIIADATYTLERVMTLLSESGTASRKPLAKLQRKAESKGWRLRIKHVSDPVYAPLEKITVSLYVPDVSRTFRLFRLVEKSG